MKQKLGWLFIVAGILLLVIPALGSWLEHYVGLAGLLAIFIGVTLLKKRKDQLMK
jgi:hypothetical protein